MKVYVNWKIVIKGKCAMTAQEAKNKTIIIGIENAIE